MRVPCTKLYRKIMTAFSCRKINNVHYNITVQCFYRMEDIVSQLKILRVPCTKLYRKIMTAFSCRKINNVHYNVTVQCFYTMKNNVSQGGGGTRSINDGGSGGASYCEPKKIHEPEIVHPKKYLASTFLPQKVQDLVSRY